jgi:hypothetical protein
MPRFELDWGDAEAREGPRQGEAGVAREMSDAGDPNNTRAYSGDGEHHQNSHSDSISDHDSGSSSGLLDYAHYVLRRSDVREAPPHIAVDFLEEGDPRQHQTASRDVPQLATHGLEYRIPRDLPSIVIV